MLEPPAHSGAFRRPEILRVAARLLRKTPQSGFAAECVYLMPGKLTVLCGPSNTERSRFALGLVSGLMESTRNKPPGPVRCFNRRWLSIEAIRMLLQHETSRQLQQCACNHEEAMIQAIEHIQYSGLEYDTQCKTVAAICAEVQTRQASQPAQLVLVDGLEHYHTVSAVKPHPFNLSKQLVQLKGLAKKNAFPVLATCPSLIETIDEAPLVAADYSIHLCNQG